MVFFQRHRSIPVRVLRVVVPASCHERRGPPRAPRRLLHPKRVLIVPNRQAPATLRLRHHRPHLIVMKPTINGRKSQAVCRAVSLGTNDETNTIQNSPGKPTLAPPVPFVAQRRPTPRHPPTKAPYLAPLRLQRARRRGGCLAGERRGKDLAALGGEVAVVRPPLPNPPIEVQIDRRFDRHHSNRSRVALRD